MTISKPNPYRGRYPSVDDLRDDFRELKQAVEDSKRREEAYESGDFSAASLAPREELVEQLLMPGFHGRNSLY